MVNLKCQSLCLKFDEKLEILGKELESQSEKFMNELEDVEMWIYNAYSILREEPGREIEGIYSQEEMDAEEDEVMGQRSHEVGPTVGGRGPGRRRGGGRRQFGRFAGTPDLFSSDGSLGSEGFMGSLEEDKVHDTSVDPDLSDDEYSRQIVERVISPEPEGDTSVNDQEYNVAFSMSTNEVQLH